MLQPAISAPQAGPQRTRGNHRSPLPRRHLSPLFSISSSALAAFVVTSYLLLLKSQLLPGPLQPTNASCAGRRTHRGAFLAEQSRRQHSTGAARAQGHALPPACVGGCLPQARGAAGSALGIGASQGQTGVTSSSCCLPGGSRGAGRLLTAGGKGCTAACLQTPAAPVRCRGSARLWFPQGQPCWPSRQQGRRGKTPLWYLVFCEFCC